MAVEVVSAGHGYFLVKMANEDGKDSIS
jgi:hypothetical protein